MISARLDVADLQKLSYIEECGECASQSDAVKAAINMAYDALIGTKKNLKDSILDSGFVGMSKSALSETSVHYKTVLSESYDKKWI